MYGSKSYAVLRNVRACWCLFSLMSSVASSRDCLAQLIFCSSLILERKILERLLMLSILPLIVDLDLLEDCLVGEVCVQRLVRLKVQCLYHVRSTWLLICKSSLITFFFNRKSHKKELLFYNVLEGGTSPDLKIIWEYSVFCEKLEILRSSFDIVAALGTKTNKHIICWIIVRRI